MREGDQVGKEEKKSEGGDGGLENQGKEKEEQEEGEDNKGMGKEKEEQEKCEAGAEKFGDLLAQLSTAYPTLLHIQAVLSASCKDGSDGGTEVTVREKEGERKKKERRKMQVFFPYLFFPLLKELANFSGFCVPGSSSCHSNPFFSFPERVPTSERLKMTWNNVNVRSTFNELVCREDSAMVTLGPLSHVPMSKGGMAYASIVSYLTMFYNMPVSCGAIGFRMGTKIGYSLQGGAGRLLSKYPGGSEL